MSNHLNSDQQLDQAVKEALESCEVPFDSSAWAEMEKQLAAQPKPLNPFKKFSFSLNTVIAVGVVAGGLLIYKLSASNDNHTLPVKEPVVTAVQPEQKAPEKEPVPEVTSSVPVEVADTTVNENEPPAEVAENNTQRVTDPAVNTNSGTASQTKKPKEKKKNTTEKTASPDGEDFDFMKVADQATKSSPAFGDQIDPMKGFINPSNESENVKREAFNKTSGWGDQVLKTMKSDSSGSKMSPSSRKAPAEDDSSDESSSAEKKTEKKSKPKKSSSSGKDTSAKSKPDETASSQNEEVTEKTDTTEKPKVKGKNTPRYKGDKTVFDE